ncbi:hypothetical protein MKW94_004562, partial [Papaver nudicaule]|nr:hypothetical protein [Papaver nudicaule]
VIEDSDDDEIPANRKGNRKRLKKKYQVSDSDSDNEELVAKDHSRRKVPEIEDEDIVPISHMINKKDTTEKIGSSDTGKTSEQLFKPSKDSSVPSSDVGLESDVMPKTKKRKNCVDDGDAKIENMVGVKPEKVQPADMLFKPSKEASLPSTVTRLKTTSKKKHRRNCGEDGDAKNIVVDGVEPEKEQPTDSDVKSKKKIRKNKGENVDVKTENMGQDPVEIKPTQPDDNTTFSVGHVTDQDNGEKKKKKKKKRVQKSAENANDEEEKNR